MKLEKAIDVLECYQLWQTGEYEDYYHEPQKLYNAIEVVLAQVKKSMRLKTKKEIAMEIRRIRMAHNYTQVYVASQMGISQPEYSKLENAKRKKPNMELLSRFCEFFEVPMMEFLQ